MTSLSLIISFANWAGRFTLKSVLCICTSEPWIGFNQGSKAGTVIWMNGQFRSDFTSAIDIPVSFCFGFIGLVNALCLPGKMHMSNKEEYCRNAIEQFSCLRFCCKSVRDIGYLIAGNYQALVTWPSVIRMLKWQRCQKKPYNFPLRCQLIV